MARPKGIYKEFDKDLFEQLCKMQATEEEIAACLKCHIDTLNKWCKRNYVDEKGNPLTFQKVYGQLRKAGFVSLRRAQWKLVEEGNPTMQIWYGRNYLGQTENPTIKSSDDDIVITVKRKSQFDEEQEIQEDEPIDIDETEDDIVEVEDEWPDWEDIDEDDDWGD